MTSHPYHCACNLKYFTMKRYRYRDDIATADAAFEAWGKSPGELFTAAVDAAVNVMVEDLDSISGLLYRSVHCESDTLPMLLYRLLEEVIFYKDAESLLLRVSKITITPKGAGFTLDAVMFGETIDPEKHSLDVDIKAVTLYRLRVEETKKGWEATVVLDI